MDRIISNILQILVGTSGGLSLITLIIAFATLVFVYGIFKYIFSESAESRNEATNTIVFGLVVLFVMVSVWGLVSLVKTTLDINDVNMTGRQTQSIRNLIR